MIKALFQTSHSMEDINPVFDIQALKASRDLPERTAKLHIKVHKHNKKICPFCISNPYSEI